MKVTSTQFKPLRGTVALPGFIALSMLLLLLPENGTEPLRLGVRAMLQPLLRLTARTPAGAQPLPALMDVRAEGASAAQDLLDSNVPSSNYRAELERANAEIIRLRDLIRKHSNGLLAPEAERDEQPGINADVIARRTIWQEPTLGLNKGTADGARQDAGVMHRGAVVGRIVAAGAHASSMALLTHRGLSIGARLVDSRSEGVLSGCKNNDGSERLCRLQLVTKELKAKVGEQVVTSGLDGCFPAGLWLGTVVSIKKNPDFQWELSVQPARDESNLETVRVLAVQPPNVPWPVLPEKR